MTPTETYIDPDTAARLFKALANRHRLVVLAYLCEGESSVGDLERRVGISQSALSQHLARLRRDRLVQTRRDAQTVYYALKSETPQLLRQALASVLGDRLEVPPSSAESGEIRGSNSVEGDSRNKP